MTEEPVPRRGARVLVLDEAGRVLLLRGRDPAGAEAAYWFTIGGGLDDGETPRTGALRELFEETGLRAAPEALIGPVHAEVVDFPFDGRRYRQDQEYFVLRMDAADVDVDTSGFNEVERATIDAWRWWSAQELRTTDQRWFPAELPDLLDRLAVTRP